jgi:dTDP-4-amino-4,6-dideoxygalactose transaminase
LEAFRLAGIGPEGALLAPAYHCRTMIDPAFRLGASVRLYSLTPDLRPDMDSLRDLVERVGSPAPRALLVPHYFGFAQALAELVAFCAEHRLLLIEDCSHSYFGQTDLGPVGAVGDYSVASPYKFFPSIEGGVLRAKNAPDISALSGKRRQPKGEASLLLQCLQDIRSYKSARFPADDHVAALDAELKRIRLTDAKQPLDGLISQVAISPHYLLSDEARQSARLSRWIVRHTDISQLLELRRRNFLRWIDGLRGLPNCKPLFSELPEDVVPYMFPCYIENPHEHFVLLKRLGLPLWRWDEMMVSDCQVAGEYRTHLIHLPCHQALEPAQIEWMISAFSMVMRQS